MPQIVCENLSVGYEHKPVAQTLNFSVNPGDYLCIVGENGAGKTTLMKTLLGLLKPISGTITKDEETAKYGIGYLPQQAAIQKDFPATVMEVVLSGFQHQVGWRPFYGKARKDAALLALENLGVKDLAKKCFSDLSGGQQQRVLLARALCGTRNLLLVDEPVSSLDPLATEEMYAQLKHLNDHGVSIVMITHDLASAKKYATHMLLIDASPFFGTKEEFLAMEGISLLKENKGENHD